MAYSKFLINISYYYFIIFIEPGSVLSNLQNITSLKNSPSSCEISIIISILLTRKLREIRLHNQWGETWSEI